MFRLTTLLLSSAALAPVAGLWTQLEQELVHLVAGVRPSLITVIGTSLESNLRGVTVGSGLALSADGLVLTAGASADRSDQFAVELPDGRRLVSRIMGEDLRSGLRLLRAEGARLTPAPLGDPQRLQPGSMVFVVGRQSGSMPSISPGVVWGLAPVSGIGDPMIQIAAANPAPAGGAVVGSQGEIVGLVVGIQAAAESASDSMLYAVPADHAIAIARRIEAGEDRPAGYLGVNIQELTPRLKKLFELPDTQGVLIAGVVPDGPADQAGVRRGDVVVGIDRQAVATSEDLLDALEQRSAGAAVELEIVRSGETQRYTVTLAERPPGRLLRRFHPGARLLELRGGSGFLGIQAQPLTDQLRSHFGVPEGSGVLVAEVAPGSAAERAGLRAGDVILRVGQQAIGSPLELVHLLERFSSGDTVSIGYLRDGREQQTEATLSESDLQQDHLLRFSPRFELPELGELHQRLRDLGPLLRERIELEWRPELEQQREQLRHELEQLRNELEELKRELREKGGS